MSAQHIKHFFDPVSHTFTYVVKDPGSSAAAIIDPVLDYDSKSGKISTQNAERVLEFVKDQDLDVQWVLETHVHADHLSAGLYFRERLGARIGIGKNIASVQDHWSGAFNYKPGLAPDPTVFDHLFADGETVRIGDYEGYVLETPGHTSVDVSYVFGDKVFVGDTLFMPDYGTARCDFPGGDARRLWKSIHKLLALPDETQLYMCHDYLPEGRSEFANMSTVAEQKRGNSWLQNTSEDEFVAKRQGRDKNLSVPALLYPALQVNVRAGHMPPAEDNGVSYMKIPISINE